MNLARLKHNGIFLIVMATVMLSTMGAMMKVAALHLPVLEVIFFRNVATALFVGLQMAHQKIPFRGKNKIGLASRSLFGFSAMALGVFAMTRIPLAQVSLLSQTAPLFVAILSFYFLGERFGKGLWGWIILGFAGVALVLSPTLGGFSVGSLAALGSGFLAAAVFTSLRYLGMSEDARRIVFHFSAWGSLLALPSTLLHGTMPAPQVWGVLAIVGVVGTAGQLLLTEAYHAERATVIGSFSYLGVLFAATYGWWLWGEILSPSMIVGGIIIIVCGVMVARQYAVVSSAPG